MAYLGLGVFQCALFSGAAAAVKWLKVPGEAHVTSSRAGPSPPLLTGFSLC